MRKLQINLGLLVLISAFLVVDAGTAYAQNEYAYNTSRVTQTQSNIPGQSIEKMTRTSSSMY
jgi:hypothetical protein